MDGMKLKNHKEIVFNVNSIVLLVIMLTFVLLVLLTEITMPLVLPTLISVHVQLILMKFSIPIVHLVPMTVLNVLAILVVLLVQKTEYKVLPILVTVIAQLKLMMMVSMPNVNLVIIGVPLVL
jgi:hypothetical protein